MRSLFIIPLVLMSLVSFPSWGVTMDDLVEREDLHYKKFTEIPFTGKVEGKIQGNFKNGNREGYWEVYNKDRTVDDGQTGTGTYKTGVKVSD